MVSISGVTAGAVQPLPAAEKVPEASAVQRSEENHGRQVKPVLDEYVPEEPREPSGRYWVGKDEEGQPKIYFDDPQAAETPKQPASAADAKNPDADAPEAEEAAPADAGRKSPEKKEKEEVCRGDTGKVDREIEKLKKKKEELERRLSSETDAAKIQNLKRQLAQAEQELSQKDNETYRRQHTQFS